MIPEELVDFVHGPMGFVIGTRDAKLRPCVVWASGARADGAKDEITVYIADVFGARVLRNLEDNGLIAVTVGHGPAHETFQFKGRFIEARPSSEQDFAVQEIYRSKTSAHYGGEYGEDIRGLFDSLPYHPSIAVRFKVTEIFDQTPGPNAGSRVAF
jgi:hypothetical protein